MSTCHSCGEFFDEDNESQRGFCGHCGDYQYDYDETTPEERAEMARAERSRVAAFRAGVMAGINRSEVKAAWFIDAIEVEDTFSFEPDSTDHAKNALWVAKQIQGWLRQPLAEELVGCNGFADSVQGREGVPSYEDGGFTRVQPVCTGNREEGGDEYCDSYMVRSYGFLILSNQYRDDQELRSDVAERLLPLILSERLAAKHKADRESLKSGPLSLPDCFDDKTF